MHTKLINFTVQFLVYSVVCSLVTCVQCAALIRQKRSSVTTQTTNKKKDLHERAVLTGSVEAVLSQI